MPPSNFTKVLSSRIDTANNDRLGNREPGCGSDEKIKKEYPMRKPELAASIAERTGLTREKASEVITTVTDQISAAAARGEDTTLIGFGTFNIRAREARDGRNPQTGAAIRIPASKTVGFKAGKALKDAFR